jgi:antitoxin component YwqK of YwqJK toxin-antitoxin module
MAYIKSVFFVFIFFTCFFTSENFNAQKINQFNKNKERTGLWKKYHPNKRIRYVGQFKNGKEIGVFKFYDITTSKFPVIVKNFSKNSDSVFVQFYKLSGKIDTKGFLLDRKRIGKWTYFYPNGKIMSVENYNNGLLYGAQYIYYPNGKTTEFALYLEGVKNGITKKYSSKGILIEEVYYKNGKPNGVAKYFELNGNLKETGTYKNGKRVGKWEYYLEGEIATDADKKKKNKFRKKKEN